MINFKGEKNMNYKRKRKQMGLTQEAVAKKIGISLMAWQLIERGVTRKPQPETQQKINKLFGKEK